MRFRGGPIGGTCWVARARKASAIRCGCLPIMPFHPFVSITSVACLQREVLRVSTSGQSGARCGSEAGNFTIGVERSLLRRFRAASSHDFLFCKFSRQEVLYLIYMKKKVTQGEQKVPFTRTALASSLYQIRTSFQKLL